MIFVTHDDPVGRAERNWIARADLAPFGLTGQAEQLWLHAHGDDVYSLACVPFCVYGLALYDRVRLSEDGGWVTGLVEPSGHRVLRMLWASASDIGRFDQTTARIKEEVAGAGLPSEWRGGRHVAIDIPPGAHPSALLDLMTEEVESGRAHWEWADAANFTS